VADTARTVRLIVSGRVQGVGYRAFVEDQAEARGLSGWVRNRRDGSVEAVLHGATAAVDAAIAACRRGPPAAVVTAVAVRDEPGRPPDGFSVLPTA
jgi:acylphosphatase